ncbi:response regulator [Niveispirillum lacus]|nr:response regulator [Niveispirillum lacus]
MPDYDFRSLAVVIVDHESNTRRLLRGILARMGVDKILDLPDTSELSAAMIAVQPDLLFIDADASDPGGLKFVQGLRHAQAPHNPFVGVIVTTWQPTQPLLLRFNSTGADDMMVKPFSTKQVQDRLTNLIEARKSFVVTADYIGPDRRRQPREGIQIPLFEVPNTLRMKALGQFDRNRAADAIADSLDAINQQKIVRSGFQVAFLIDFALPGLMAGADRMSGDHLLRAGLALEDMMRRLKPESDVRKQAESYAAIIRKAVDQFKTTPDQPLHGPQALRVAAMGVAALTSRRADLTAVENEVRGAVNAYRTRLAQIAQAKAEQQQVSERDMAGEKPAG